MKRIKESLRRLRFPRLAQTEDEIHGKIRALKLQPEIRMTVAPGLEGGRLQIEFTVTNQSGFLNDWLKSWPSQRRRILLKRFFRS